MTAQICILKFLVSIYQVFLLQTLGNIFGKLFLYTLQVIPTTENNGTLLHNDIIIMGPSLSHKHLLELTGRSNYHGKRRIFKQQNKYKFLFWLKGHNHKVVILFVVAIPFMLYGPIKYVMLCYY